MWIRECTGERRERGAYVWTSVCASKRTGCAPGICLRGHGQAMAFDDGDNIGLLGRTCESWERFVTQERVTMCPGTRVELLGEVLYVGTGRGFNFCKTWLLSDVYGCGRRIESVAAQEATGLSAERAD
nr:hypothetical protein CFP56_09663 [Quercus suber]